MSKVIVIGGGAAGMMAALKAAENGHDVTLLEKMKSLAKAFYHRKGSMQRDKCLRYGDNHEPDRDKSTFSLQCVF